MFFTHLATSPFYLEIFKKTINFSIDIIVFDPFKYTPPMKTFLRPISDNVCRLPTAMDLKAQTGP